MKNLLLLFLLLPVFVNAQKIIRTETDKFTKQRTIETSKEKLVFKGAQAVRVNAITLDSNIFINFLVTLHEYTSLYNGDSVLLLLDGDNILPLYVADDYNSVTDYGYKNTGNFETLEFLVYPLSKTQIDLLLSTGVKAIRIYSYGKILLDADVPEKFKDAIKNCVKLVV